jgi:hypothetical protein
MLDFSYRYIHNIDWITGILLLMILFLGFAKMIHQDKFNKTLRIFTSNRFFLNYGKESNRTFNTFSNVMHIVQLLSFALLVFLIVQKWTKINEIQFEFNYLDILGFIAIYFIGKLIIGKFIGIIFRFNKLQEDLLFLKISYLNLIAIYFIPLCAFLAYTEIINREIIYLSIIYILFLFLYSYILILLSNKKIIYNYFFYFILYICTLEIAPLLIVMKLVF